MGLRYPKQSIERSKRRLKALSNAANDLTPIWPHVGNYLSRATQNQFATRGRRSGHLWKPLAVSTRREKARKGYPRSPLVRTGEMKRTLVGRPMEVEIYRKTTAEFGTNNPKASWQHHGTFRNGKRHIPPRKIVVLTDDDRANIQDIIKRYLVRRMRAGI